MLLCGRVVQPAVPVRSRHLDGPRRSRIVLQVVHQVRCGGGCRLQLRGVWHYIQGAEGYGGGDGLERIAQSEARGQRYVHLGP